MLAAMLEWLDRYGALPSSYDWSITHARRRGGEDEERPDGCNGGRGVEVGGSLPGEGSRAPHPGAELDADGLPCGAIKLAVGKASPSRYSGAQGEMRGR